MRVQDAKVGVQRLVTPRFSGLTLERTDLALHFFDHVADAKKIRFGGFQFAQRLPLLRFVFRNAGGFFKNGATIFRPRAQDHVDLALLHHRISGARDAGVGEKILDVAQAARRFVEQVFGIAIAINATRYAHVVPIDFDLGRAIGERERDFGETQVACECRCR